MAASRLIGGWRGSSRGCAPDTHSTSGGRLNRWPEEELEGLGSGQHLVDLALDLTWPWPMDLTLGLDLVLALDLALAFALDLELALDLTLAMALDLGLDLALALDAALALDVALAQDLTLGVALNLALALVLDFALALDLKPETEGPLSVSCDRPTALSFRVLTLSDLDRSFC